MRQPNLQAMQAYRRVVEMNSFNAAARSLDTTGGNISKQVAQLESDLGVRLLNRTTRTLSVTEEGNAFFEAAVRILDAVAAATEEARSKVDFPAGRIKVAVPTSFALMWLASRMPAFLDQFPGLTLELDLNDRFVDLVAEGFDCALRIAGELPDSRLVARRLGSVERVLVAAPKYLKRAPQLKQPEDLRNHACLIYTQTATPNAWPLARTANGRPVDVDGRYRVNNSVILRDALLAGQGVALTPQFVVADLVNKGKLVEMLPRHRPPGLNVFGITPNLKHQPRKVRVFLDFVEAGLAAR